MVDVAEIKIWGEFVGAIRWDNNEQLGFFEYDQAFLRNGWDLSPIHMPINQGAKIYSFPELRPDRSLEQDTFQGLPGLIADVLPDKYGNQLINAWLAKRGRPLNSMNPIEKLCFIGRRGMGALTFQPTHSAEITKSFSLELDSLIEVTKKMLNQRETFLTELNADQERAMKEILKIGTSAGGARPKAVIAYNSKTKEIRSGQGNTPKGFEHWLLKLDGVSGAQFGESTGWGRVEYAYYLMAIDCEIQMSESHLLEENGRAHFMTKRFDREGNMKHHIQTLCGMQHFDYNAMYSFSYEQVFQTMRKLRLSYPEAEEMFKRMVFNVLSTNCDDHTKNFSFMLEKNEKWKLAPAYDLCFAYDPDNHWVNQQTLSINGKRKNISKIDLMTIAEDNNIKKGPSIIENISNVVCNWKYYATKAQVRRDLTKHIFENLRPVDKKN